MSDGVKTIVYAAVALVVGLVAYVWRPAEPEPVAVGAADAVLFPEFKDPLQAKSLEITGYDEKLGEIHKLTVEQQKDGSWIIPTHNGYPADAENQLRDAATALVDLRSLGVASEVADEHGLFGVKAPDKDEIKLGEQGVGLQVRMLDEKGQTLAALIIGGKVRGADDQRFVRVPNQDPVYVVKIDPTKLSTKFGDWIEKDLLKLNALDVQRVRLRDYSVFRADRGFAMDPRLEADVAFDSASNQWNLESMQLFNRGKPTPARLADNEELNKEKLDGLKTALDDLQIVDVHPKPKGLKADLKADAGFLNDKEGVESLFSRGFFPLKAAGANDTELYSANGEVHVAMKDGVEYLLRFGNIAGAEEGSEEGKLNRFLFVMARLDESQFAPPQLEPEPADVPAPGKGCADDETEKPSDEKPADEKPAEAKPADEKPTVEKPAEAKPESKPESKPTVDPAAERERIKKANQQKLDEFRDRRKKAEAKVAELNARFADWYYVIPEDTYKKVHLGRVDLVKEKSASSDEGIGVDSFRKLQEGGVDAKPEPEPGPGGPGGPGPGGLPPGLNF